MKRILGLALALLVGLAPDALAQATGNIYGSVRDESGAALPGAIVRLSSDFGTREATSGPQGDFRFINLDRGTYKLLVSLVGFTKVTRDVTVSIGSNVDVAFDLKVATVEETVTVTAETPVVDTKKVGTGVTIMKEELEKVPNARDPWAMLRSVPGVIVDRVNIGGNENGQQANFTSKGDDGDNAMWNLDGVNITDMSAIGASPTYYDFDAFEEVGFTTGGTDVRVQTGGVGINLTTRRGTNQFRGSVHNFLTHDDLQWSNLPSELATDARLRNPDGSFRTKGDHIRQISDYGGELGGPIVKDKLWFYGSWGRQDIRLTRINGTADKTLLTSYNAKLNWQPSSTDMVSVFYFQGDKEKFGRGVGTGLQEQDEFLWDQGGLNEKSPKGFLKAEWNRTFSPDFFLSLKASQYQTGFFLHPRCGDCNGTLDFEAGVARGAYLKLDNVRPAYTANADASYFFQGMGGGHELKFGFGYRSAKTLSTTAWGGNQLLGYNFGGGYAYAKVIRDAKIGTQGKYWSGYVGDTFTKDRLTLNVGVRWDRQTADNSPLQVQANKSFPNLLPAVDTSALGLSLPQVEFTDFAPRAGLTYALDESRKTLLRASYARYAAQLFNGWPSTYSPIQSFGSYLAYLWNDLDGDGFVQPNEVRFDLGLYYWGYVDPNDTSASLGSPNQLDLNHKNRKDDEFIVGLERELFPNFAVGAAYTYRKGTDIFGWQPRINHPTSAYTPFTSARNGYSITGFRPDPDLVEAARGGRLLTNRPDYSLSYNGFEATMTKRLANKWMARAAFTWQDPTENIKGAGAIDSPLRTEVSGGVPVSSGPQEDGGLFAPRSAGSGKGDTTIGAKWQLVVNALAQLPAGFELSGSLFGRGGHPRPINFRITYGLDGLIRGLANDTSLDTVKYDSLWNLDLRLAKTFHMGRTSIVASADLFNVFNSNAELSRFRSASSGAFNRLDEILNPRVARFGLRFQF